MRKTGIHRIVDANLNRSREGLRVCEDIARFVLNSAGMSKELKQVRHGIASAIKRMPCGPKILIESRDSRSDVLRASRLGTEMRRRDAADVLIANIQRAKESLRVLEEVSKLVDGNISVMFRRLRFRVYEIEKRMVSVI